MDLLSLTSLGTYVFWAWVVEAHWPVKSMTLDLSARWEPYCSYYMHTSAGTISKPVCEKTVCSRLEAQWADAQSHEGRRPQTPTVCSLSLVWLHLPPFPSKCFFSASWSRNGEKIWWGKRGGSLGIADMGETLFYLKVRRASLPKKPPPAFRTWSSYSTSSFSDT